MELRTAQIRMTYTDTVRTNIKKINGSASGATIARKAIGDAMNDREILGAIALNSGLEPLFILPCSVGGTDRAIMDLRLLLRDLLVGGASSFIIFHNHPSGEISPSGADRNITDSIQKGAAAVGIRLLDHVIVTTEAYFSFSDAGMITRQIQIND